MAHDVFDATKRSAIMRAVKSTGTAPELTVRAAVRALGYGRRYRLNGTAVGTSITLGINESLIAEKTTGTGCN